MIPRSLVLPIAGLALASCFSPPSAPVLFSCDPIEAPRCPDGYACEADGCCHRDGSDVDEHLGECREGVGTTGGSGTGAGATETDADSGTTTGDTADTTGTTG